MFYITKFLVQLNPNISQLWDDRDDPRVVGDVRNGNVRPNKMSGSLQHKVFTIVERWRSGLKNMKKKELKKRRIEGSGEGGIEVGIFLCIWRQYLLNVQSNG